MVPPRSSTISLYHFLVCHSMPSFKRWNKWNRWNSSRTITLNKAIHSVIYIYIWSYLAISSRYCSSCSTCSSRKRKSLKNREVPGFFKVEQDPQKSGTDGTRPEATNAKRWNKRELPGPFSFHLVPLVPCVVPPLFHLFKVLNLYIILTFSRCGCILRRSRRSK